jgi:nitrate/nitrite transporter NarK
LSESPVDDRIRRELKRLWQAAGVVVGVLVLAGAGAITGLLFLLDGSRSDDLRRVAALALLGGTLGAAARGVFEVVQRIEEGWELSDGTMIERGALRRQVRARDLPPLEPRREAEGRKAEWAREQEETERELELWRAEHNDRLFGVQIVPSLLVLPIVGAALGLAAFAGTVGGFLVATGDSSQDYSPAGLLFVAFLAGLFAESFISALARGADALFGTAKPTERPTTQTGRRPE